MDFNPEDFLARVNSDLIGKYVNIASRVAGFIIKRFGGRLCSISGEDLDWLRNVKGESLADPRSHNLSEAAKLRYSGAVTEALDSNEAVAHRSRASELIPETIRIRDSFENREFGKALRMAMLLADIANKYDEKEAPTDWAKDPEHSRPGGRLHQVSTTALAMFRALSIFLKPVLPTQ